MGHSTKFLFQSKEAARSYLTRGGRNKLRLIKRDTGYYDEEKYRSKSGKVYVITTHLTI